MPYVYFLKSLRDGKKYIGSTKNLRKRIKEHLEGKVIATKHRRPLKLIGWREFDRIKDAALWEKKYKNSHGQLQRDINKQKIIIYTGV